jgi:hypothetical protein
LPKDSELVVRAAVAVAQMRQAADHAISPHRVYPACGVVYLSRSRHWCRLR